MTYSTSATDLERTSHPSSAKEDAADDEDSCWTSTEGESAHHAHQEGANHNKRLEIARSENRRVFWARLLVVGVLCTCAALVAYFTWKFVQGEEQDDYQTRFDTDALELIRISDDNANSIFSVLTIFANLISSSAYRDGATFPRYTFPDFERFGVGSRELSGALLLAFSPLVTAQDRALYENYTVTEQGWIQNGLEFLGVSTQDTPTSIVPYIYRKTARSFVPELETAELLSPVWQMSPAPSNTFNVNFNLYNHPTVRRLIQFAKLTRQAAISEVLDTQLVFGASAPQQGLDPQSLIVLPVQQGYGPNRAPTPTDPIVGHVIAVIPWGLFFQNVLQEGQDGIYVVLRESCAEGQDFTYLVNGPNATFMGIGDFHDTAYDHMVQTTEFRTYQGGEVDLDQELTDHCEYQLDVYPSKTYQSSFETNEPILFMIGVLAVFVFTSLVFVLYDYTVKQRQEKVVGVAAKSSAIVSSLFPEQVRQKLFDHQEEQERQAKAARQNPFVRSNIAMLRHESSTGADGETTSPDTTSPIADLFPSATVMFMDIAGFTAWSSGREPSHVFVMLETYYRAFDKIAKQLRVFKVETIGDCYMAVTGLPEPMEDHALTMARFTRECLHKMKPLTEQLCEQLGPDTANLAMRAGFHSGPVTAGVLRGERARFQLFGDTVNTASRMESTGIKKHIQISQASADLIIAAGKGHWLKRREDKVVAKGKGEMTTYWVLPKTELVAATSRGDSSEAGSEAEFVEAVDWVEQRLHDNKSTRNVFGQASVASEGKDYRLIEANTDILARALRRIAAFRNKNGSNSSSGEDLEYLEQTLGQDGCPWEELNDAVSFESSSNSPIHDSELDSVVLDANVTSQLRSYVSKIASMYRANSFHNFEHASHVTQAAEEMIDRILTARPNQTSPDDAIVTISADPLAQFSLLFACFIHDVDHRGVPNSILTNEDPGMAALYDNQALAEQNSVTVAWLLLMEDRYAALRTAIYATTKELKRFRQLVVHTVLVTDIFDPQLGARRERQWQQVFGGSEQCPNTADLRNTKATLLLEHMVRAADVIPTMQEWSVYIKWNDRLYREMYVAFAANRSDKDPTDGWFKGELWFFDNYVLKLARMLVASGVLTKEALQHAQANRQKWEEKGMTIVQNNHDKIQRKSIAYEKSNPELL